MAVGWGGEGKVQSWKPLHSILREYYLKFMLFGQLLGTQSDEQTLNAPQTAHVYGWTFLLHMLACTPFPTGMSWAESSVLHGFHGFDILLLYHFTEVLCLIVLVREVTTTSEPNDFRNIIVQITSIWRLFPEKLSWRTRIIINIDHTGAVQIAVTSSFVQPMGGRSGYVTSSVIQPMAGLAVIVPDHERCVGQKSSAFSEVAVRYISRPVAARDEEINQSET